MGWRPLEIHLNQNFSIDLMTLPRFVSPMLVAFIAGVASTFVFVRMLMEIRETRRTGTMRTQNNNNHTRRVIMCLCLSDLFLVVLWLPNLLTKIIKDQYELMGVELPVWLVIINGILFAAVDIFWLSSNLWSMSIAITILLATFSVRKMLPWEIAFHIVNWGFPGLLFLVLGVPSSIEWSLTNYFYLVYLICYASIVSLALTIGFILRFIIVRRIRMITKKDSYQLQFPGERKSLAYTINRWLRKRMLSVKMIHYLTPFYMCSGVCALWYWANIAYLVGALILGFSDWYIVPRDGTLLQPVFVIGSGLAYHAFSFQGVLNVIVYWMGSRTFKRMVMGKGKYVPNPIAISNNIPQSPSSSELEQTQYFPSNGTDSAPNEEPGTTPI